MQPIHTADITTLNERPPYLVIANVAPDTHPYPIITWPFERWTRFHDATKLVHDAWALIRVHPRSARSLKRVFRQRAARFVPITFASMSVKAQQAQILRTQALIDALLSEDFAA
jgi:hypothetical protein